MLNGLVVFSTKSCMPCRQLKTQLDEAGVKYQVVDLGSEENDHYKFKYNIRSVPYVAILEEGKLSKGLLGKEATVESVKAMLS